jgi:glycosyltransferase involved in cell wall biosynthesis
MKVLQINSLVNSGSTGRIAEDIGKVLMSHGHESYIAYGRGNRPSASKLIKIGNIWDVYSHVIKTRLFDRHGFGSTMATRKLLLEIENIRPDLICLHNIHGYYINIYELFTYLNKKKIPIVWFLHDCWAFTGHCTYFDDIQCTKWETGCFKCPKHRNYPASWIDNSKENFQIKKHLFSGNKKLEILVYSKWLADLIQKSYLSHLPIHIIPSAIDTSVFRPVVNTMINDYNLEGKKILLGCANIWTERKGLKDLVQLAGLLSEEYRIVVIGVNAKQKSKLPKSILGIERTENVQQLAEWYSLADVFINPTYQDNFPTTNIEALACGTPVITYDTGGSPEAVDEHTGRVVPKGDIQGLLNAIRELQSMDREKLRSACRTRALEHFDKDKQYLKYLELYNKLLNA